MKRPRLWIAWVRSHVVATVVIVLVLAFGASLILPKKAASPYETAVVARGDLVQDVTVTGKVESEQSIDLAFERGGRIVQVNAEVGDAVKKGDVILRLDASDLSASLAQAEANVAYEEANLDKLVRGARPEDVQVSQVTLENAQAALEDAQNSLTETLTDAYTKMDDAVRNKTDVMFANPRIDPQLLAPITDARLSIDILALRKLLETDLLDWSKQNASLATGDLATDLSSAKKYLADAKTFLDKLALATGAMTPTGAVTQTIIDTWKSSVSTARTNVNAAISSVVAAEEKWRAAKSSVALSSEQLALKKAGATVEELNAQRARVAAANASVASYRAQIAKLALVAPFDGVVTREEGKPGAIATANATLVSLQSEGTFKIEANVPEVDISKISTEDVAAITLDAYGEDVRFTGSVASIDPAERVIDGIPTYKVTLRFDDKDGLVRSGMTANVHIVTEKREGVLAVPARAVSDAAGAKTVRLLDATGNVDVRTVTTGLRGSDGRVEVLTGLSEGDNVITYDKSKS